MSQKIKCYDLIYEIYFDLEDSVDFKIVHICNECYSPPPEDNITFVDLHFVYIIYLERIEVAWMTHDQIYEYWEKDKINTLLTKEEKEHFHLYKTLYDNLSMELSELPFYYEDD